MINTNGLGMESKGEIFVHPRNNLFYSGARFSASSETQGGGGGVVGARGNKSGKEMKRCWFTSKAEPATLHFFVRLISSRPN